MSWDREARPLSIAGALYLFLPCVVLASLARSILRDTDGPWLEALAESLLGGLALLIAVYLVAGALRAAHLVRARRRE